MIKAQMTLDKPPPEQELAPHLSRIVAYIYDSNMRMFMGVFTLEDSEFRNGRDRGDGFLTVEDKAWIVNMLKTIEPDGPWLPFYPEHADGRKPRIYAVFELVWISGPEAGSESIRWFLQEQLLKVHPEILYS